MAPKYGYNIEAAKAFLRKSSYRGEQLVVNVTRGAVPNFDLAVEYMAEQWNALGIKVKLNVVDSWPLALQHPFGLLNMSMDVAFDSSPTRAIWGFWGPESARATREADRSWTPPAAFIEKGNLTGLIDALARDSLRFERGGLFCACKQGGAQWPTT